MEGGVHFGHVGQYVQAHIIVRSLELVHLHSELHGGIGIIGNVILADAAHSHAAYIGQLVLGHLPLHGRAVVLVIEVHGVLAGRTLHAVLREGEVEKLPANISY